MKKIIIYAYLIFTFGASPLFFLIVCITRLLTFWFDKKGVSGSVIFTIWSYFHMSLLPKCKNIKVIGREKIDHSKAYVVVANHQSMLDIMIGYYLRFTFKWVSKAEMFKVPFVGWAMTVVGYISVKRGDRKGVKDMVDDCTKALKNKSSVFIFPEGTRSKDGEIGNFMTGAFSIAKDNQVDILPIIIRNTAQLLPYGTLIVDKNVELEIEVLDPIPYEYFKEKSVKLFAEEVRQLIKTNF